MGGRLGFLLGGEKMAINVRFYNFTKKPNSTKRPITGSWMYPCVLKDSTSIIEPMIVLDTHTAEGENINPLRWNYCYIPDFNRYYFITNIIANHNLWNIYLRVDVLASFSREIEAEEAYVVRASKIRDQFLSDATFPTNINAADGVHPIDTFNSDIQLNSSNGSFIVGVINPQANNKAIAYYALSSTEFNSLKEDLFTIANFRNLNNIEISDDLLKVLFNPFQYIASVTYIPISPAQIAPSAASVYIDFGWWGGATGISATGRLITSDVIGPVYCGSAQIFRHPDAGNLDTFAPNSNFGIEPFDGEGQYLNYAPYSRYYIRFEPFGFFELDNNVIGNALSSAECNANDGYIDLSLTLKIDPITGKGYFSQTITTGHLSDFYKFIPREAIVGIPIQIGQITSDVVGGALAVSKSIGEATSGFNLLKPVSSAIAGATTIAAGIYDGLNIAAPKLQTSGTQGGFSSFHEDKYVVQTHQFIPEHAPQETGYPLMRNVIIGNCKPGFVKTLFTDIQIANAMEEERTEIVRLLNSGVHLEENEE